MATLMTTTSARVTVARSYHAMQEGCDVIYGETLEALYHVPSPFTCSMRCVEHRLCRSAKYSARFRSCVLNRDQRPMVRGNCSALATYLDMKVPKRRFIGESCSASSECSLSRSQCVWGWCQCRPGYSYRAANESCLPGCDEYGSTFTLYTPYVFSWIGVQCQFDHL